MKIANKYNKYLLKRVFAASLLLVAVLYLCLNYVLLQTRKTIEQTCFETLEAVANEVSRDLRAAVNNDIHHLNSLAVFISTQEDLRSQTVLDVLQSFDCSGMLCHVSLLYPDNQVLVETGEFIDATGILSFETENRLGVHVSDKSTSILDPGTEVLRVFVPVLKNDETAAILYGTVELPRLADLFELSAYNGNVELYVADCSTGDFLMDTWHKDLGNFSMLYERKLTEGYNAEKIFADIKNGGKGYFSFMSKTIGEKFYIYYQPAEINNWATFLTVPESIVLAQVEMPLYMLRVIAVSFVLAFAIYSIWIFKWHSYITRMFLAMPTGGCILTSDGSFKMLMANKAFYDNLGVLDKKKRWLKREKFLDLLDENAQKKVLEQWKMILACEPTDFEYELDLIASDGSERSILARIYYDRHHSRQLIVNVLDITARKRMEDELRISEERYRLALMQSGKEFFFLDVPTRTMHLSDELAQAFGLPNEVEDMPENFISRGLVEPQSVENYRNFYKQIFAGELCGDTIISCHVRNAPEQVLWYKISFISVLDAKSNPHSAAIIYEDLQEKRAKEIAGAWKQLNLLSVPESKYVIAEYNLTQDRLLSQVGGLFVKLPKFITSYDETNAFVLEHFIYEEDAPAYRCFLDRNRILDLFEAGETEDYIEYRALQSGSYPRWTSNSIQTIRDPYSGDILMQMLFMDIHAEKVGQIEMVQNIEKLKKDLENSRIKVMINQMQPHFLYNALASIQILIKRDPDRAYKLIRDFTVHLRSSIKALSSDEPIPFTEELSNVQAYLNIEIMRLSDKLQVEYDIACEDFLITPLTIQPLVENSVKHGVFPKGEEGGQIILRSYETAIAYVIEVQDNGLGFDVKASMEINNESYGLKNLVFRLKSLLNAEVSIKSEIGIGTLVTVHIPKNWEKGTI